MMKKNLFYTALTLVASFLWTGCSNDEVENSMTQKEEVYFLMEPLPASRTSTTEDYETKFVTGDAVGIFAYERMEDGSEGQLLVSNAKYMLQNDGTWKVAEGSTAVYADVQRSINYYAYYPYSAEATNAESIKLTALSDQSVADAANYNLSDALAAANTTADKGAKVVRLSFKHLFSLIQVNIEGTLASKEAVLTLQNIRPSALLNLKQSTATVDATSGAPGEVTMYSLPSNQQESEESYAYRAVVPAQTINAGDVLLKATSNGKTFELKYSVNVPYEAGKLRVLKVLIGEQGKTDLIIPASDVTIEKWGTSEAIEGNGTVEETTTPSVPGPVAPSASPVTEFSPSITTSTSFKEAGIYTKEKMTGETDYWFHRENTDKVTVVTLVSETESAAIQLAVDATKGSWNNSNIGYHCAKTFERGQYTLTLKVKSSIENGIIGLGVSSSGDNKFFKLCTPQWTDWKRTVTTYKIGTDWVEKTLNIDLTQALPVGKSSEASDYEETTEEDVKAVNLYFYNYAPNSNLQIKDIKIAKKQP